MLYKFTNPESVEVVIFDNSCNELFTEYVLDKKLKYTIIESKLSTLFITPKMIWMFIKNIIKIKNNEKNLFSYLYKVYLLTTINLYNPKIVLTFLDNDLMYHWLVRNDNSIKYLAIQNGIRQKFEFDKLEKHASVEINHDYYFCFGMYDIDFNKRMGFKAKKSFPCGSLKLGISEIKVKNTEKKYDICLLSNYKQQRHIKNCPITKEIIDNNLLLDKHVSKYSKQNNKTLIIALRTNNDEEINYYKSIYGEHTIFSSGLVESYSSYRASRESQVTLAYQSTLLLEMLATKNKVLHIDFTDNKNLFDYDSPIKYKFKTYDEMVHKINDIYMMNLDQYINITKNQQKYVMNYDSNNPPHEIIKNEINIILNSSRTC